MVTPLEQVYHFCPRCGAGVAMIDNRIVTCAACALTLFVNTAAAAGVIIRDVHDRILFVVRQHEPDKGKLGLPGGFVEYDETAEESARREVKEEVNLDLAALHYLCSFPNHYEYKGICYRTLDLFYEARVTDVAAMRGNEEVAGIVWLAVPEIELEQIAFASVRRAVARSLNSHGG